MTALVKFANYISTTLAAPLTSAATSMVVSSVTGLPTITGAQYYYLTLVDNASYVGSVVPPAQREVVKVTAAAGTTLTIARAQDSTTAQTWAALDRVELRLNAAALTDLAASATTGQPWNAKTDFGAIGDGTTDDTAALQAMLTAMVAFPQRAGYIPAGTYKCTSSLVAVPVQFKLYGDAGATVLMFTSTTANGLVIGDGSAQCNYVSVIDILISGLTNNHTAGIGLWMRKCYYSTVLNVRVLNQFISYELDDCVALMFDNNASLNVTPSTGRALVVDGGNDQGITNFSAVNTAGFPGLVAVEIRSSNGTWYTNVDAYTWATGLLLKPSGVGKYIEWQFFEACAFDSCTGDGILLDMSVADVTSRIRGVSFDNCWSSSNLRGVTAQRTGTGYIKGITFDNFKCFANQNHGMSFNDTAMADLQISDSQIAGNGTATANTYDGIVVLGNITGLRLEGNTVGTWANITNNQRYGINIAAGVDQINVEGNDLRGNVTAPLLDASTTTNKNFVGNLPTTYNNVGQAVAQLIRNGQGMIAQRAVANLATGAFSIGKVDGWYGGNSGGVITAGTITQNTAAAVGRSGFAMQLAGVSTTGAGVVNFRQRIESKDAVALKNQTASFAARVLQDTGGAINATVVIRKATVLDNFTGTTVISTSATQSVPNNTDTLIKFEAVAMGDCSNGIEIEVQFACGVVTTKNFYITEAVLGSGAVVQPYPFQTFDQYLAKVQRYYIKTFPYATAPAQNAGTAGALLYAAVLAGVNAYRGFWSFPVPMRDTATPVSSGYSPSSASSNWRNTTLGADSAGAILSASDRGAAWVNAQVAGDAVNAVLQAHFTVDCEL